MTPLAVAVGQHASAGLGPCPRDPLRCGLKSSTPHIVAMLSAIRRSSPIFLRRFSTVLPCLLLGLLHLEKSSHLPSCGIFATVGWVGAPGFVSDFSRSDGRCVRAARGAQASSPKPHGEGCTLPGWSSSVSTALGPASTVHRNCKGQHADTG